MELKEFIKTAITDITSAVSELQSELENGAIVSPSISNPIANSTIKDPNNENVNRRISNIDFDVALTVGDTDTIESGGKVGIHILSAKICGENKTHTENVSRITFSIPIVLPTTYVKTDEEKCEEILNQNANRLRRMRKEIDNQHTKDTTNS